MIFESSGIMSPGFVGITLPVDPLVMVPDDQRHVGIRLDLFQDAFADLGVALAFPRRSSSVNGPSFRSRLAGRPILPMS